MKITIKRLEKLMHDKFNKMNGLYGNDKILHQRMIHELGKDTSALHRVIGILKEE